MRLTEIIYDGPKPIDSYGPGFFRVDAKVHYGPLLVLPDQVLSWQGLDDLTPFLAHKAKFDVLFLGMGSEVAQLPEQLRISFDEAGIGVELMATPAACRTYNVLLLEGRRVAAGLLPV